MADWYCDAKDGLDTNGGTSWGDAVKTITKLDTLASSAGDNFYILGHGEDYVYNFPSAELTKDRRHWIGVKNGGALWRPPFTGWPILVGAGTQTYDGPYFPRSCKDFVIRNFDVGVNNLRYAASEENVVERCNVSDCNIGIIISNEGPNLICRYNLVHDCDDRGIRLRTATTDKHILVHHNSVCDCPDSGFYADMITNSVCGFDEFHSNIFQNCGKGMTFASSTGGSVTFDVAGEPNYNVFFGNTTDISDEGSYGVSKGANELSVDAQFLDAANKDFRLAPGSPALYSDASGNCRGALGPGPTMVRRMRGGKFFSDPGKLIEAETLWRDEHLIGT